MRAIARKLFVATMLCVPIACPHSSDAAETARPSFAATRVTSQHVFLIKASHWLPM
jgi:hypothetical protein